MNTEPGDDPISLHFSRGTKGGLFVLYSFPSTSVGGCKGGSSFSFSAFQYFSFFFHSSPSRVQRRFSLGDEPFVARNPAGIGIVEIEHSEQLEL